MDDPAGEKRIGEMNPLKRKMKSMKQNFILAFVFFLATGLMAQTASEPTFVGDWATSTNNPMVGLCLKARLVVSEAVSGDGSRTAVTYVEFQNTNYSINVLYIYYDGTLPELTCELVDSRGKSARSQMTGSYNGPAPQSCWLALPPDSIVRCRPAFFRTGTATNGELLVDAGFNQWRYWVIPRGDTNDYFLSGTLNLTVPKDETPPPWRVPVGNGRIITNNVSYDVCHGTIKLPPVKIPANGLSGQ